MVMQGIALEYHRNDHDIYDLENWGCQRQLERQKVAVVGSCKGRPNSFVDKLHSTFLFLKHLHTMGKLPEYHVLNFFHDDNGCSMTALVHCQRYHVVADSSQFQDRSNAGKRISREFRKRIEGAKEAQVDGDELKHTAPLFVQEDEDDDTEQSPDSGIDVTNDDDEEHSDEPTTALERWLLSPLKEVFSKDSKNGSKANVERSVKDWYHCPTHYYDLCNKDGKLHAQREDAPSSSATKRTDVLIPSMPLPKYIRNLEVPMIKAEKLKVLGESSTPAPIHPSLVQYDGKKYFIKVVDNSQHGPLKRELQVMKRIESEGLHNEIRVPLLRGLVHFGDTQHIMGFLMDAIDEPQPLTGMLDTNVAEEKRLQWADDSARMVDLLHQHNIIWGDAKGDNFVVDSSDNLWIIDFGGSYTEGWVDPELNETEEGDEMGVQKVYNGLRDPEKNTMDPGEEEEATDQDEQGESDDVDETAAIRREINSCKDWEDNFERERSMANGQEKSSKKRKQKDCHDWEDAYEEGRGNSKKQRASAEGEGEGPRYCYCNGLDSGKMLACDGPDCKKQWFHFSCVGIQDAPAQKKWFCEECREQMYFYKDGRRLEALSSDEGVTSDASWQVLTTPHHAFAALSFHHTVSHPHLAHQESRMADPPQADQPDAVFESMRSDRLISIYIANEERPLLIQQSMLCAVSDPLKAALTNERFVETQTGVLRVPEDDLEAWKIFTYWLVRGRQMPELPNASSAFRAIKAWVLGDKYQVKQFQDDAMYGIMRCTILSPPDGAWFEHAFSLCTQGSLPRKCVAEHVMRLVKLDGFEWDMLLAIRAENDYAADLLEAMITCEKEDLRDSCDVLWNADSEGKPIWMKYMVGEGPKTGKTDMFWHFDRRWRSTLVKRA